eukprot:COSAG05_NODE_422_length_9952_cov_41.878336_5_plen_134_part_00
MSLRSSRPRAGDTASQLWAYSLDAGELIDKLDATNQTALADLVRDFFSPNGQLIRIVDNHLAKWKGELLKLSDPVTDDSDNEAPDGTAEGAGSPVQDWRLGIQVKVNTDLSWNNWSCKSCTGNRNLYRCGTGP